MTTVETNYPVAYDSPDHIMPYGTANDNYTDANFVDELQEYFKVNYGLSTINFMDLGCSGGQLAIDFLNKGNFSVGLEGSDYSVHHKRANWPQYHNTNLFTADITKPYKVYNDGTRVYFDLITSWEVVEHIADEDLNPLFSHISDNLKVGGIFLASVCFIEDVINGVRLHQSVHSKEEWYNSVLPRVLEGTNLEVLPYDFKYNVRGGPMSFHLMLRKTK
jgi:SAM-dependent methyltransferase